MLLIVIVIVMLLQLLTLSHNVCVQCNRMTQTFSRSSLEYKSMQPSQQQQRPLVNCDNSRHCGVMSRHVSVMYISWLSYTVLVAGTHTHTNTQTQTDRHIQTVTVTQMSRVACCAMLCCAVGRHSAAVYVADWVVSCTDMSHSHQLGRLHSTDVWYSYNVHKKLSYRLETGRQQCISL